MSAHCRSFVIGFSFLYAFLTALPVFAAEPLLLVRAEALAISQAPWFAHHRTNATAAAERVVYQGRLPDPQLTVGAINVPADSFNLRNEDMTMLSVGVRQVIPPGETLAVRERRATKELSREEARLEMERRNLTRQIRGLWLDLYLQEQSARTIDTALKLQERALSATEGRYRAAQEQQQAVLRARQARARMNERALMAKTEATRLRARLSRYIGEAANDPMPEELPTLPALSPFDATRHPEWLAMDAGVAIAKAETDLIRQEYKPGVMLDLSYGFRRSAPDGTDRPNMVSAMVTVDLPVFRDKRQDRRLHEKQTLEEAARLEAEDKRRELDAMYRVAHAEYEGLEARVRLIADDLVPNVRRESQVTTGSLRDTNELREARIKALDVELELLRLRIDLLKSRAELLYLSGEP